MLQLPSQEFLVGCNRIFCVASLDVAIAKMELAEKEIVEREMMFLIEATLRLEREAMLVDIY